MIIYINYKYYCKSARYSSDYKYFSNTCFNCVCYVILYTFNVMLYLGSIQGDVVLFFSGWGWDYFMSLRSHK